LDLLGDLESDVDFARLACGHLHVLLHKRREALGIGFDRISSGSQAIDFVGSIRVNDARLNLSRGGYRGNLGGRDGEARGVRNLAANGARGILRQE